MSAANIRLTIILATLVTNLLVLHRHLQLRAEVETLAAQCTALKAGQGGLQHVQLSVPLPALSSSRE